MRLFLLLTFIIFNFPIGRSTMKKKISLVLATLMLVVLFGCSAHTFIVGNGAKGGESVSAKQWYVLYGLIPLGNVDTKAMAGGATDYTIKARATFVDLLLGCVVGCATFGTRTVTIEK